MTSVLAITGSRQGITAEQREFLMECASKASQVHHGGCTGADLEAHRAALSTGIPVTVHLPADSAYLAPETTAPSPLVTVVPCGEQLAQYRAPVDAAQELLAFPDGPPRKGSRTWYTVWYAVESGVPTYVVCPDGLSFVAGLKQNAQDWARMFA